MHSVCTSAMCMCDRVNNSRSGSHLGAVGIATAAEVSSCRENPATQQHTLAERAALEPDSSWPTKAAGNSGGGGRGDEVRCVNSWLFLESACSSQPPSVFQLCGRQPESSNSLVTAFTWGRALLAKSCACSAETPLSSMCGTGGPDLWG